MKRTARLAVILSLILTLAPGSIVGEEAGASLPSYNPGDAWVYRLRFLGKDSVLTCTYKAPGVTNGIDCWVFRLDYTPPYMGAFTSATLWLDKRNAPLSCSQAKLQLWGVHEELPYVLSTVYLTDFFGDSLFPLKVGAEFRMSRTSNSTKTQKGRTSTSQSSEEFTYRVEAEETISTPMGRYNCFRIAQYLPSSDMPKLIEWYAPEVKNVVKTTVFAGEHVVEVQEMVQCSLTGSK